MPTQAELEDALRNADAAGDAQAARALADALASMSQTPTAMPPAPPQAQPDFLDRARQSLQETYNAPDAGFMTKAAATLGNVPVSLARGLRDAVPAAITAPRRSITDPNFDAPKEAVNLAGLIALGPIPRAAAPLVREAAGAAGTALKEVSPVTIAPKQAPVPTLQDISNKMDKGYKAAREAGIVIAHEPFKRFADETASKLRESGLNDRLHPNVAAALDDIKAAADSGQPQTLQQLETLRRVATSAVQGALNNDQASKAGALVRSIDRFYADLGPEQLTAGINPEIAIPVLKEARDTAFKKFRLEEIKDISDTAARQDDPQKYIKQQFTRITKDTDKFNRFSPEEQKLVLDIARNGSIGTLAKLAPSLDLAGIAKIGAYAGAAAVNPLSLALPAVGMLAKRAAERGRMRNIGALQDTIARGGPPQGFLDRIQLKPPASPPSPPPLMLPPPTMQVTPRGQALNSEQAMRFMTDEVQAGTQPGSSRLFAPDPPAEPIRLLPPPRMFVGRDGQAMGSAQMSRYFPDERQAGVQPGTTRPEPQAPAPERFRDELLRDPVRDMLLREINRPQLLTKPRKARKSSK